MAVYYKQNHLSLFNRTSAAFVRGIGNFESDVTDAFFIGLERLHLLTSGNPHEIMVYTGGKLERCDHFEVGNRSEGYVLKSVGECTGNSLSLRQGTKFSTYDQDEDGDPDHNLALDLAVGWWFRPGATSPDYNTFISMHIRRKD
ncbi:ryncolin-4-like [Drosophila bipectinata]|uniref:ryncolin-4-like n=1 Tax=Drosophila bipectinata TaxID=42026 RepID=UPI0038B28E46